jgi:hypothetical protein
MRCRVSLDISRLMKILGRANGHTGSYEFIKRGDPAVMGITKLAGDNTPEYLKRPRIQVPLSLDQTADRLPSANPL